MKLVAFGTSFTSRGKWPVETGRKLAECSGHKVDVTVVAQAGATTEWGLQNVDRVVEAKPDIITIEFYGNDSAIDELITVSRSNENFKTIVSEIRAKLPEVRIVYVIMNPVSGLRGWIRPWMESYISAQVETTKSFGGEVVDLRPIWNQFSSDELKKFIPDGIHASPTVANVLVSDQLSKVLAGGDCTLQP